MNRKNIKKLRDFIAKLPSANFNMAKWIQLDREYETVKEAREQKCGTVCCLAGWTALLIAPDDTALLGRISIAIDGEHPQDIASRWLQLNEERAYNLFQGYWTTRATKKHVIHLSHSDQKRAALKELDHLLETGEV